MRRRRSPKTNRLDGREAVAWGKDRLRLEWSFPSVLHRPIIPRIVRGVRDGVVPVTGEVRRCAGHERRRRDPEVIRGFVVGARGHMEDAIGGDHARDHVGDKMGGHGGCGG